MVAFALFVWQLKLKKKGGEKEERPEPKQHASHRQACVLLADKEAPHNKLGQV